MTSSCLDHCLGIGTHVVGPLPDWEGLGEASWAWEWHFLDSWPFLHWDPRSGSVARLESSIFAQKTAFLESRRALSSVFWAFFDLGTSLAEPDPNKTGLNPNLGDGEIRHVIESTSFSSPTGLQTAHQTPGDPPDPPPGGLEIICIFF